MSGPTDRHLVVAQLRDQIRRIERRPARREGSIPCGRPEVDSVLPGGGFPRGALSELSGGPASGKTAVALALFAALGPEDLFAWVDARGELYPPAAAALGVDLARLLVVRPGAGMAPGRGQEAGARGGADRAALAALWAAEALLGSGAFAAVAIDAPTARLARGADQVARRLQAAAEKGGAVGLWLASPGVGVRVPAAVRLELSAGKGGVVARRTVGGVAVADRASGGEALARRAGRAGHAA
jgi:protein ImuA